MTGLARRQALALAATGAFLLWCAPAQAAGCEGLKGFASGNVRIVESSAVAANTGWRPANATRAQPVNVAFCRVEGTIETNIGFELWLPLRSDWNGRFLMAGVGGDAGVFNYGDMGVRLSQGFASASTDSGHKASQKRWMTDAKARVDYEHRATHLTTAAAKELVARFYGKTADHSYFLGCSGGGRQGLKEMQNYPADFDGIVSGAPGPNMPLNSIRMMWFSLQQKWQPSGALADADWSLYEAAVVKACDSNDGVVDGVVENPMSCRFDRATLLCKPGATEGCLTAPKLAMLDAIVSPMPDEKGRAMDKGLLPGVRTRPGRPSPLLRAMWADAVYDNPDWDEDTFQRTADLDKVNALMPELRADRTTIAPFIARRGKAIIYQGWQDPSVVAGPTIDYYLALAAANGGLDALSRSVRLFMVPGMYHCARGPGADQFGGSGHAAAAPDPSQDILWSMIQWVEKGTAPNRIVARKIEDGTVAFTRPLCSFPSSARWDGKGATDAAASFACRRDPILTAYASGK